MKHIAIVTRKPQTASISFDGIVNAKVETKENVINGKAGAF